MSNPSKKKGTGGELELLRLLEVFPEFSGIVKNPAGARTDLHRPGLDGAVNLGFLATRPDRGRWLMSMDLPTLLELIHGHYEFDIDIEVKRWARFAHHAIYEEKIAREPL